MIVGFLSWISWPPCPSLACCSLALLTQVLCRKIMASSPMLALLAAVAVALLLVRPAAAGTSCSTSTVDGVTKSCEGSISYVNGVWACSAVGGFLTGEPVLLMRLPPHTTASRPTPHVVTPRPPHYTVIRDPPLTPRVHTLLIKPQVITPHTPHQHVPQPTSPHHSTPPGDPSHHAITLRSSTSSCASHPTSPHSTHPPHITASHNPHHHVPTHIIMSQPTSSRDSCPTSHITSHSSNLLCMLPTCLPPPRCDHHFELVTGREPPHRTPTHTWLSLGYRCTHPHTHTHLVEWLSLGYQCTHPHTPPHTWLSLGYWCTHPHSPGCP